MRKAHSPPVLQAIEEKLAVDLKFSQNQQEKIQVHTQLHTHHIETNKKNFFE